MGVGLWVCNGNPGSTIHQMLGWKPSDLTCFFDYLQANGVYQYKEQNPNAKIIIRFQHDKNWWHDPATNARNKGQEVASKWPEIQRLDPYVYFCNEMNLHYENGDEDPGNQWKYETPEFYHRYADWVRMTAKVIKDITPDMRLVTPPFAFGHKEDGDPDDDGNPKLGWAGYDYLADTIKTYFQNILTFHGYWGNAGGENLDWLYHPEHSTWYAYRWQRVLNLFETRYNMNCTMMIDECGNFQTGSETFTDQIIDYAEGCRQDPRVTAMTPFLWLDPWQSAGNMPNSWVQGMSSEALSGHLSRLSAYNKGMPPIEPPEPPIDPPIPPADNCDGVEEQLGAAHKLFDDIEGVISNGS